MAQFPPPPPPPPPFTLLVDINKRGSRSSFETIYFHDFPVGRNTSVARILQWRGFENHITFDHTLYTGADPESFCGVNVILNQFES